MHIPQHAEGGGNTLAASLEGVYLGWAPTEHSPSGLGELELVIGQTLFTMRHATGAEVRRLEVPRDEVAQLPPEEVLEYLFDREKTAGTGGLRISDTGATLILDPHRGGKRTPPLAVYEMTPDSPSRPYGLTRPAARLFMPEQIERGYHGDAFRKIERRGLPLQDSPVVNALGSLVGPRVAVGSRFPRLRNDGRLVR